MNADLRGGDTSEGVGDLFSDEEARDYYDLIDWVGAQDWSSGRVGLDGVSYLAISQYKVALRPPHLVAICPWEGFSDVNRDFTRPDGVLENGFSKLWSWVTGKEARVRTSLYQAIMEHPEREAWRGSFEVFRRAGSRNKSLYTHRDGKWCAYYSDDATQTRIRFFDHFLKELDNGWDREPAVRLAITEAGPDPLAIVHEDAWPPRGMLGKKFWLDAPSHTM